MTVTKMLNNKDNRNNNNKNLHQNKNFKRFEIGMYKLIKNKKNKMKIKC